MNISTPLGLRRFFRPLWAAWRLWLRKDCVDLSAAFAYHTLQSLFPALLIVLSMTSRVLGRDAGLRQRLIEVVDQVLPSSAFPFFVDTLERFTRQGFGAGILGAVLLVVSANNIYLTLQRGADRLWWNRPFGLEHLSAQALVQRFLVLRIKAFLLLVFIGVLLVFDQLISHLRLFGSIMLHDLLLASFPDPFRSIGSISFSLDYLISLAITFFAVLVLLWLLPSRRIRLRKLVPGALVMSLSLTVLNVLLGRTLLALGFKFQAYGVVGGVLLLTLWVWLIGVLLYFAQCLCVVLSPSHGGGRSTPLVG